MPKKNIFIFFYEQISDDSTEKKMTNVNKYYNHFPDRGSFEIKMKWLAKKFRWLERLSY
jgi:hypothetical protein